MLKKELACLTAAEARAEQDRLVCAFPPKLLRRFAVSQTAPPLHRKVSSTTICHLIRLAWVGFWRRGATVQCYRRGTAQGTYATSSLPDHTAFWPVAGVPQPIPILP